MYRSFIAKVLLTAIVASVAACTATTSVSKPVVPLDLRGDWRGTLVIANAPDSHDDLEWRNPNRFRFVVSESSVRVYAWDNETWRETKPGTFDITTYETSAVITSITSGTDEDGVWVETWSFAVTVIDSDHLRAMFQRQVNNKDMKRDDPAATWGQIAFGILERAEDADV
jgi:hypothetical protein